METTSETEAVISNLYPTSKYKLVVWEYFGYRKYERLFVLEDRQFTKTGHKAAANKRNTSNMFTYISEHHPSVQIQLCPIYNLRLKPYDIRDVEWIPESSHDNEFTMQMSHKTCGLMDWWINQKQSCQITTWSSVFDYSTEKTLLYKNINCFAFLSVSELRCHLLKNARWRRS